MAPVERRPRSWRRCTARGFRLGIATNDAETSARAQAESLGLLPFLDFIVGYDSGHGGKPEPGMVTAFARRIGAVARQGRPGG